MKNLTKCILALLCIMLCNTINAQISGTVFRDFNGNGVKNNSATFNEPFVAGITVRAFNSANVQLGATKTTDAVGAYSFTAVEIPSGTAVRIEFSGLASGDYSSLNGSGNGSNVQFATAPSTTINYAVNAPDDYWDNTGLANPKLLSIVYGHGDINHTNSANTTFGVIQIDNNSTGSTPTKVSVATQAQVGSVWGMGYQKTHNRYFFSSFLKRHTGLGPQGVGGVYMANLSGANYALSGSFTLQGVTPSNSGTALDMGTVNRVSTPNTSDFYLATGSDAAGRDMDAFGKAGKVGFGDIEVDDRNQQLVLVNLNQRRLVTVDISGTTASLNNASAATLGPLTRAYDILTLPGVPACVSGQLRPFALKIYKGRGYLGVVCDASATPRDSTNLAGYILSFNPANIAAGFTTEITMNFNYRTSTSNGNTNRWHSWADVWSDVRSSGLYRYPEPLISDLEFDENGGLNISVTDRFGHQMGVAQTIPVAGSSTTVGECRISGDILHACRVGSSWVMEGAAGSCTPANTVHNADGYGDGQTVGVYEWYDDQSGDNAQGEYTQGAMAKIMGTNRLIQTIVDPSPGPSTTGEPYWYTAGMHWYDVNSGSWSNWTSLYDGSGGSPVAGSFMKGNGLGDIELVGAPEPIQIGNRIWTDTNGNGIQDAGETTAGVATGTTVTLRSPGVDGIYGTGDDQTWTTTTDAAGNYYFSALSSADNRKPATWTGIGNTILPGFEYRIELAIPAGLQLSRADAAANAFDNIDNDATQNGANAIVVFTTSNVNHNFDIGLKPLASLGDKVWRDDDLDGIQDSGEPGVAGITVTLYDNLGNVAATTVTDAYGFYLFDNLAAGTYQVGFTAPANYAFTTQTNNTDNTVLTGGSTAANGSDINAATGRTANIVLTAGENERNIDAGLIFSQPLNNSIGDRVWLDSDGNGNQNGTEPGISGVTVTLYASDGVTIVATTITDANGNYLFTGLPASTNYIVGLTLPAGMTYTSSGGTTAGNATINSDVSATTGKTTAINTGAAGNQITGIDAGLVLTNNATASLGDKVWIDLPGGTANVQDAGEPGLAGVTVNLYRDANADNIINGAEATIPYATTVTDAFGNYIFNNLPAQAAPGMVYQVRFVLPGGYTFVTQNVGTDDFKNSDPDVTGLTKIYRISNGQRNMSVDAGVTQNTPAGTARFGDRVWFDANSNGVQDAGEPGVGGITVTLYNSGGSAIGTTTTDANGYYQFINLAAASYSTGFSNLPVGYSFTTSAGTTSADATTNSDANPATGRTANFALLAGQSLQGLDCGLIAGIASGLGSIGNKVWYDLPTGTAGVQEPGELGVAGVTVTLLDAGVDGIVGNGDDGASRTTTTNALGEYIFTGLPAGNYAVQFSNLPGTYTVTTSNAGIDDGLDSDGGAVGTGGAPAGASRTGVYNLAAGEDNLSVDLGLVPPANTNTLGNYVWFDRNSDGIQDANEQGIAGIMVRLYNNAGTAIALTTTNVNGEYLFTGLADGNYSVGFTNLPPGFDITTQSLTNTANGSDADRINGRTATVTLNAGNRNDRSLDAGLISSRAALGNFVWMDSNGDGIQTAGELPVPGVTVSLFRPGFGLDGIGGNGDDALPVASMITDQNGQYLFENLVPGTYQVSFTTIPTGILFTQQDAGGNDNLDSDVNPATGLTGNIVLAAGDINLTVDAGLFKPRAVIGNYIWADGNHNGIQDANERGYSGVVVTLFNGGIPVATAVTDGNGGYLFPNVAPGTYSLVFSNLPTGVTFTTANAGGDDNVDSDVSGTSITGIVVTTTTVNLSFDGGLNGAITLASPIEFTAFRRNTTAELTWKLSTASNEVKEFVVERSANGTSYDVIATVSSTSASTYMQTDLQPNGGINYYRIKIIYHTGAIKYSEVRVLNFNSKADISVFPNPTTDFINIQLPDSWQGKALSLNLFNQAGQVVNSRSTKQASQVERLSVNQLASGIYLLRIQDSNGNIQTTRIKVN